MKRIFLDVGHMYGAKAGASYGNIDEGPYNDHIVNSIETMWRVRISLENLLNTSIVSNRVLRALRAVSNLPYMLIRSNEEHDFLLGTYEDKAELINSNNLADAVIQMHLNAAKGKYAIVGFDQDSPHKEESLRMAEIAGEELEAMSREYGELISNVKIIGCSKYSEEPFRRRIHYCIRDYDKPAILMEPLFLDNEAHNKFLDSLEGQEAMVLLYARILERVGSE